MGSLQFRIQQLCASTAAHLRSMHLQNPLVNFMKVNFISSNTNFILSACNASKLLQKWKTYSNQEKLPLKFKTWLQHEKSLDLRNKPGILHHYILPSCRNRSKMDQLLKLKLSHAKKMLAWRVNSSFIKGSCPTCHENFNRGHRTKCNLN